MDSNKTSLGGNRLGDQHNSAYAFYPILLLLSLGSGRQLASYAQPNGIQSPPPNTVDESESFQECCTAENPLEDSISDTSWKESDASELSLNTQGITPLRDCIQEDGIPMECLSRNLAPLAFGKFQSWMELAQYFAPPDRLPSVRHRTWITTWWAASTEGNGGSPGYTSAPITRFYGYFHLACPYYISDRKRHQSCLRYHDFLSVEDVINHLWEHHREPPYCHLCYKTFDAASERDSHVRARTCKVRSLGDIDGLNNLQRKMLRELDKPQLSERKRWRRVWATVFPNSKPLGSPYLEGSLERSVSMFRDYWAGYGRDYILQQLANGSFSQDWVGSLDGLYVSMLEVLLNHLFEAHGDVEPWQWGNI